MSRAFDAMTTQHPRARVVLHALEVPRNLIDSPVTLSRDEDRRHVDGPPGEQLEFRIIGARGPAPVPVEPALEAGPGIFGAVDAELVFGKPSACRDLFGR